MELTIRGAILLRKWNLVLNILQQERPRLSHVSPAGRVPNPQVLLFHRLCWPLDRCSKAEAVSIDCGPCFRRVCGRPNPVDYCSPPFSKRPSLSQRFRWSSHVLSKRLMSVSSPSITAGFAWTLRFFSRCTLEFPNFRPAAADIFFPTDFLSRAVVSINGTWRPWCWRWKLHWFWREIWKSGVMM